MSNKDKSKFKLFFKNAKMPGTERALRPEMEVELRPEHHAAQRCKTLRELGDSYIYNINLDEKDITRLYELTKDLIVPNKPAEHRHTALSFYKKLIHSQYKNLSLMREHFFLVIQNHEVPEDLRHRLELLDTLTENGKDITNFEEKIGRFMLSWIPAIAIADLLGPYLAMLVNIIKFNAAHLDNDTLVGIVQNACQLSCTVEDDAIGLQCLTILEIVIGYAIFPSDPLALCVVTLCRTVNHRPYCQVSWKIMKNLLGTQLGYHSMQMMCNILNDRSLYEDQQLLRGAVFHLNMSVFGSNVIFQVPSTFYATTVLTSFLHALDSRQVIVTYEVILSVRKVINKYKTELSEIIWDRICDIMSVIVDNIYYYEANNIDVERLQHLQTNFHETIDCIEQLLQDGKSQILGNVDRIYDIIERVCEQRPELSVLKLIEYYASKVTANRPEWLRALNEFVGRFYRMSNTNVRIKTIQCLMNIMDLNRSCYEEEILERVVIPYFGQIQNETDIQIRIAVAKALIDFSRHCDTKRCGELLDILEKMINRPFEYGGGGAGAGAGGGGGGVGEESVAAVAGGIVKSEADIRDIITIVDGLIEVFVIKLHRLPSCHAIKIFNILIGHLELHYDRPRVFEQANIVRYKILSWMLKARANSAYHIGYPDPSHNDVVKFSYYLGIDSRLPLHNMVVQNQNQRHTLSTTQLTDATAATHDIILGSHFTTISIRRACKIIVRCLECDRDYKIFQLVLRELPRTLQNKALIYGNDIEALATALFKISCDGNKSINLTYKPTTDEFNALILPAIASLVTYHQSMQKIHHQSMISSLIQGIFSGTANVCINTMTTIILEMPEAIRRTLPDILLKMTKMSDTSSVAMPVLEFLSILTLLANYLCTNFTTLQYMYFFAISLPYTKSYRYDHYIVSLAHHVIAGLFLKCKLEVRKNFVGYIISSIQSNTSILCDDINKSTRQDFNALNEDSSNRKRSTSLTERGSRNTQATRNDSEIRPTKNDNLKTFHAELAETCIDFLARHTYSLCSALPKRLPAVDYLLKDGASQTWLVGHNLITITTSGCPSAPTTINGLCERCSQMVKTPNHLLIGKNSSGGGSGDSGSGSGTATAAAAPPPPPPLSPEIIANTQQLQQQQQLQIAQLTAVNQNNTNTNNNNSNSNISLGSGERRYTKVSLQHSSGNESAGSTDLTSSSSSGAVGGSGGGGTQRQTSNSSTASFEALSRRGSNPEAMQGTAQLHNSSSTIAATAAAAAADPDGAAAAALHMSGSSTSLLGGNQSISTASGLSIASPTTMQMQMQKSVQQQVCIRSCTGWAEILIRRPTGNISWITRIQNPIPNDCFGQDIPLNSMFSLFLPTLYGGVFGPDFVQSAMAPPPPASAQPANAGDVADPMSAAMPPLPDVNQINSSRESPLPPIPAAPVDELDHRRTATAAVAVAVKVRALQRQEEISSSTTASTAAIDIPKQIGVGGIGGGKRAKESLSGSVSDGEVDEDTLAAFNDDPTSSRGGGGRARNPVRRVNSSPEMSSSWRHTFLASKPPPLSREGGGGGGGAAITNNNKSSSSSTDSQYHHMIDEVVGPPELLQPHSQQKSAPQTTTTTTTTTAQGQKKKSVQYTKDMRVSCEAIPEEIAGSTPPQTQSGDSDDAAATTKHAAVAPAPTTIVKTLSADTTSSSSGNLMDTTTTTTSLPIKQHSADEVIMTTTTNTSTTSTTQHQHAGTPASAPQLSASATSLKSQVKISPTKPPLSPAQQLAAAAVVAAAAAQPPQPPQSPRLDSKHTTATTFANTPQKTITAQPSSMHHHHHQGLAKSSSSGGANTSSSTTATTLGADFNNVGGGGGGGGGGDMMRGRSKTISVVREVNGKARGGVGGVGVGGAGGQSAGTSNFRNFGSNSNVKPQLNAKFCMNPSFVLLQLYHTGQLNVTEQPIKVTPEHMNAVALLDLVPPFETHKIGVLYVGQGQCNNVVEILRNSYGSTRYVEFLRNIGTLVSLKDADQNNLFLCLDTGGADGKFTYIWKDDIVQVTFHVATLMPTNLEKDPICNEKKKHIGNDFVHIVYNESGEDYNLNTISGQFSYACVIVEPLELDTNRVYVKARPEIAKYVCHQEAKIVSDRIAPVLARQYALHANLASHVFRSEQGEKPYASNWLERLRQIKRLRTKLLESEKKQLQSGFNSVPINTTADMNAHTNRDFTKFA